MIIFPRIVPYSFSTFCNSLSHQRTRWKQYFSLGHFRSSLMLYFEKSIPDTSNFQRKRNQLFFPPSDLALTVFYFLLINSQLCYAQNNCGYKISIEKARFHSFLKKGIKQLVACPIKVRYFNARHCRLFLESDYQVFVFLFNKLLYRIILLYSVVKILMLQPIGR